jgi:hypothetical protein
LESRSSKYVYRALWVSVSSQTYKGGEMANAPVPVTGGCLCGAIRYESSEEPYAVAYCHCDSCKKALGGVFGVSAFFRPGVPVRPGTAKGAPVL